MKKTILLIVFLFIFSFVLTGCGDRFENNILLKKEIKNFFPNTKIEEFKQKNSTYRIYKCKNKDFEFEVVNELEANEWFPFIKYSQVFTDYQTKLVTYKEKEILNLAKEYNIECCFAYKDTYYKPFRQKDFSGSVFIINDSYYQGINNTIEYDFYFSNFQDVENFLDLLKEIEGLLKPYYPKKNTKHLSMNKELNIFSKIPEEYSGTLFNETTLFQDDWSIDYNEIKKKVELNYKMKN